MDWANVVTGAVGIAGVMGTFWQGKRAREAQSSDLRASIDAAAQNLQTSVSEENKRAWLAEKRRVYIRFQLSLTEMFMAIDKLRDYGADSDPEERKVLVDQVDKASVPMVNALSEMRLAAPERLAQQAADRITAVWKHAQRIKNGVESQVPSSDGRLYVAMRADLGEQMSEGEAQLPARETNPGQPGAPAAGGGD